MRNGISQGENIHSIRFNPTPEKTIQELRSLLPTIYRNNKEVITPTLAGKMKMEIINPGLDFGQIQTLQDVKLSEGLLSAVRNTYPGSFSEEQDDPRRLTATTVYQIDPLDGTGDLKYGLEHFGGNKEKIQSPTILISKLERANTNSLYSPIGAVVFDTIHNFAFISNGFTTELYVFGENGEPIQVEFDTQSYQGSSNSPININKRTAYPQNNFDNDFITELRNKTSREIKIVPVGGAGTFGLRLLRNFITPRKFIQGFSDITPLTIGFNAQPDWKTWDIDPTSVLLKPFGLKQITDIFGDIPSQNAALLDIKKDVVYKTGCVLSFDSEISGILTRLTQEFQNRCINILEKNY